MLRVAALALLLLLALVSVLSIRTLRRLPNTIVYFVASEADHFRLESVGRLSRADEGEARLRAALDALIEGPSEAEKDAGLFSSVPSETQILGLELTEQRLRVDLSRAVENGGGSVDQIARLNQLFYTLSQPANVDEVELYIEGEAVSVFGGDGILVPQPFERSSDELPTW